MRRRKRLESPAFLTTGKFVSTAQKRNGRNTYAANASIGKERCRLKTSMHALAELKERVAQTLGRACRFCGTTPIQYAHTRPTATRGRGRGQRRRLRDILKFPDRYIPLCEACHNQYDNDSTGKPGTRKPAFTDNGLSTDSATPGLAITSPADPSQLPASPATGNLAPRFPVDE